MAVGVGASAGGLEAFSQLLAHLPSDTGLAFVLIQHLAPTHPSQLAPVLAKTTRMVVVEARSGVRVEPNHVYVIPPNASLAVRGRVLALVPREIVPVTVPPAKERFFLVLFEEAAAPDAALQPADRARAHGYGEAAWQWAGRPQVRRAVGVSLIGQVS